MAAEAIPPTGHMGVSGAGCGAGMAHYRAARPGVKASPAPAIVPGAPEWHPPIGTVKCLTPETAG